MTKNEDHLRIKFAEDARMRFEALYERLPNWEIGSPQPAIVEVAERGLIRSPVLDVGCGSGENTLFLSSLGHTVYGVDISPSAIGLARAKSMRRRLPPSRFLVEDALSLEHLGLTFQTVIDSGLLHAFSNEERTLFINGLGPLIEPRGHYVSLCFSEFQPGTDGPRRISACEIRLAFSAPIWRILSIEPTRFLSRAYPNGAYAYLITIQKV
jgi:SAM-dependent methyltransferase